MLKSLALIVSVGITMAGSAVAGPIWESFSVSATPQNEAKVMAASNAFMASTEGKAFPGRMLLSAAMFNGDNPTTHSWVLIYDKIADSESWGAKLRGSKAWTDFMNAIVPISEPTGEARFAILKSWGASTDSTMIWEGHFWQVRDGAAFVAAIDAYMASPTGKAFKGEVHLSSVVAAGPGPATHVISVGYANEAEMETFTDASRMSRDWQNLVKAASAAATPLGAEMSAVVKAWGKSAADLDL